MKINSYSLGMESTSTYTKTMAYQKKAVGGYVGTSTNMLGGFAGLFDRDVSTKQEENEAEKSEGDSKSFKATSLDELFDVIQGRTSALKTKEATKAESSRLTDPRTIMDQFRQQLIRYLEELFNKDKKNKYACDESEYQSNEYQVSEAFNAGRGGILYEETYSYMEEQSYSFSTTGTVVNSEGQEISFNLDVSMSRSFYAEYGRTFEENVSFCDPLVINLDADIAEISDQKFFFDLDCDGNEEEISAFGNGTGLLALDLTEDGIINDGKELFGTKSGDGFKDLARYDTDHNGWIDENDEIWEKVKIWVKEADGTDKLYSLKDKGVGAIYLGKTGTVYDYKNTLNQTNARLRATGLFLYESGMAGTMQQVDLAR